MVDPRIVGWLARADAALAAPPPRPWIKRTPGKGVRVARFALPLPLLKRQDARDVARAWQQAKTKAALAVELRAQLAWQTRDNPDFASGVRARPLLGRPMVLCVRFSSVEPDAYADSFKAAVDILCARQPMLTKSGGIRKRTPPRLGLIVDDAPRFAEVVQWWEPAAPKRGFGLIEVWTGG